MYYVLWRVNNMKEAFLFEIIVKFITHIDKLCCAETFSCKLQDSESFPCFAVIPPSLQNEWKSSYWNVSPSQAPRYVSQNTMSLAVAAAWKTSERAFRWLDTTEPCVQVFKRVSEPCTCSINVNVLRSVLVKAQKHILSHYIHTHACTFSKKVWWQTN